MLHMHDINIITSERQGKNKVLILPEGLDANPTLVGFMPEFRLPPFSTPNLDMYIEYFFQYVLKETLGAYDKIVAVGASAAYLHSFNGHKLSVYNKGVILKHPDTRLPCHKYETPTLYINLANLEDCIEDVKKFLNKGPDGSVPKVLPRPLKVH